jgi:bifunctional UDP-N-acetylglucosamine pyrophosphorylase/glucosamine-1-phosphate N-acetyltransferase
VEFLSSDGVIIDADAEIGNGAQIFSGVTIKGRCRIGRDCVLTSGTFIEDSDIGDNCKIKSSYVESSSVANGVTIGPFAHIRPGCKIAAKAKIGNFVEVKNSTVGESTSIAHLSYVGDCEAGARVNFGCGTIVVNYDGEEKHKTKIEDDAFVGCNANLVAPVTLKRGAFIAAGSTITEDVGEGEFAIARVRQEIKQGYVRGKSEKGSKVN